MVIVDRPAILAYLARVAEPLLGLLGTVVAIAAKALQVVQIEEQRLVATVGHDVIGYQTAAIPVRLTAEPAGEVVANKAGLAKLLPGFRLVEAAVCCGFRRAIIGHAQALKRKNAALAARRRRNCMDCHKRIYPGGLNVKRLPQLPPA